MQPAEEPDDFLPSPGAHHSFLPQAGGQALRRGGRRAQGQVGLGAGSAQGGWCPRLWPRPRPDCPGAKGLPASTEAHSAPGRTGIQVLQGGHGCPCQAPAWCRWSPAPLPSACSAAALCWRHSEQQVGSELSCRWRRPSCCPWCWASCCCPSWRCCCWHSACAAESCPVSGGWWGGQTPGHTDREDGDASLHLTVLNSCVPLTLSPSPPHCLPASRPSLLQTPMTVLCPTGECPLARAAPSFPGGLGRGVSWSLTRCLSRQPAE